ncbi:hypothetical protein AWB82_02989 [Caballeronia glebae]|uniref:Uncharacterized protein n=1 Tax=Caballeronia glebae TaxID=1777143 RepID=A0A158AUN4_9BURK|nr:hypothetical protein AWB82_02989 [Caballeronia glebae]
MEQGLPRRGRLNDGLIDERARKKASKARASGWRVPTTPAAPIERPFSVRGEFMRAKGPIRLAVVAV